MAAERKLFIGHKLRRLRREEGVTQAQMAHDLGISAAYLNLIEHNQRPITVNVLLRLGDAFGVNIQEFALDDSDAQSGRLREVLSDPLFAELDLTRQDLREAVERVPMVAEALQLLYARYQAGGPGQPDAAAMPGTLLGRPTEVDELLDALEDRHNHFPQLETAAEALSNDAGLRQSHLEADLSRHLAEAHGHVVRTMPARVMETAAFRHDLHGKRLIFNELAPPESRVFALGLTVAELSLRDEMLALVEAMGIRQPSSAPMMLTALKGYFAAAVMMPYARFSEAALETRHDLDILQARFGASFEQVAHRLTSLQRPGTRAVPFFMLRMDAAGNVSKRFSAGGFSISRYGGACPAWSVVNADRHPGNLGVDKVQLPDGGTFLSLAKSIRKGLPQAGRAQRRLTVVLGCSYEFAEQVVYADGLDAQEPGPIGTNCRLCPRSRCEHRAFPASTTIR
ncbi:MAG: short-chain fatty acyl-CoA regulator family protein [Pseudomonadota bacterium]|nr:short-chain fatty acyl-CoA regulator family protein [Pseudomonadota bacterium]